MDSAFPCHFHENVGVRKDGRALGVLLISVAIVLSGGNVDADLFAKLVA